MKRVALGVLAAVLACGVSGCGSSSSKADERPEQPFLDWRGQKAVEVVADDNLFTPPNIEIDAGTKVTWKNSDTVAHNVQKPIASLDYGAPFGVQVGKFQPGAAYSFTFKKIGNYFYTCTIHTGMNGQVRVHPPGINPPTTTTP